MSRRAGAGLLVLATVLVVALVALTRSGTSGDGSTSLEPVRGAVTPVPESSGSSGSLGSAGAAGSTAPAAAVPGPPSAAAAMVPRGQRPVRIVIPAIGVDATMTDLGIAADGSIEVPDVPGEAGWLDTTPAPGQQGPAVVAGHVDSTTGPAVFYRLSALSPGDEVEVTHRDGSTSRFTVDGVRTYAQDTFPTSEVYGPVPGPALRLITCGGDYVASDGGYQSNVVVYAS